MSLEAVDVKEEPEWEDYCISEAAARAAARAGLEVKREPGLRPPASYSAAQANTEALNSTETNDKSDKECDSTKTTDIGGSIKESIDVEENNNREPGSWLQQWAGLYGSSEDEGNINLVTKSGAEMETKKTESLSQEQTTIFDSEKTKAKHVVTNNVEKNSTVTNKIAPQTVDFKRIPPVMIKKRTMNPMVTKYIPILPAVNRDKAQPTVMKPVLQPLDEMRLLKKVVVKPQPVATPPPFVFETINSKLVAIRSLNSSLLCNKTIKKPLVFKSKPPPVVVTLATTRPPKVVKFTAQTPTALQAQSLTGPISNKSTIIIPQPSNIENLFSVKKITSPLVPTAQKTQQSTPNNGPSPDLSHIAQPSAPTNTKQLHLITNNKIQKPPPKFVSLKMTNSPMGSFVTKRISKRCFLNATVSQRTGSDGSVKPQVTKLVISASAISNGTPMPIKYQRIAPKPVYLQTSNTLSKPSTFYNVIVKSTEAGNRQSSMTKQSLQPTFDNISQPPVVREKNRKDSFSFVTLESSTVNNVIFKPTEADNRQPSMTITKLTSQTTLGNISKPPGVHEKNRKDSFSFVTLESSTVNNVIFKPTEADNRQPSMTITKLTSQPTLGNISKPPGVREKNRKDSFSFVTQESSTVNNVIFKPTEADNRQPSMTITKLTSQPTLGNISKPPVLREKNLEDSINCFKLETSTDDIVIDEPTEADNRQPSMTKLTSRPTLENIPQPPVVREKNLEDSFSFVKLEPSTNDIVIVEPTEADNRQPSMVNKPTVQPAIDHISQPPLVREKNLEDSLSFVKLEPSTDGIVTVEPIEADNLQSKLSAVHNVIAKAIEAHNQQPSMTKQSLQPAVDRVSQPPLVREKNREDTIKFGKKEPCTDNVIVKPTEADNRQSSMTERTQTPVDHILKLEDFFKPCFVKLERMDETACDVCKKTFYDKNLLIYHMTRHPPEPVKEPPRVLGCAGVYSKDNVKSLKAEHQLACKACGKTFKGKISLLQHVRYKHLRTRHFVCDTCGKNCCHRSALINHLRIHTGERPYSCIICNKQHRSFANLLTHSLIHNTENQHICPICGRPFRDMSSVLKHIETHSGRKLHACEICNKFLSHKTNLQRHMKIHTRVGPYRCKVCKKRFYDPLSLISHEKIHVKEQSCDAKSIAQPQQSFIGSTLKPVIFESIPRPSYVGNLFSVEIPTPQLDATDQITRQSVPNNVPSTEISHIAQRLAPTNTKQLHSVTNNKIQQPPPKLTPANIQTNEPAIITKSNLLHKWIRDTLKHAKSLSGRSPHVCQICETSFFHMSHLQSHMRIHTGEKLYPCKICKRRFREPSNLKLHEKIHERKLASNINSVLQPPIVAAKPLSFQPQSFTRSILKHIIPQPRKTKNLFSVKKNTSPRVASGQFDKTQKPPPMFISLKMTNSPIDSIATKSISKRCFLNATVSQRTGSDGCVKPQITKLVISASPNSNAATTSNKFQRIAFFNPQISNTISKPSTDNVIAKPTEANSTINNFVPKPDIIEADNQRSKPFTENIVDAKPTEADNRLPSEMTKQTLQPAVNPISKFEDSFKPCFVKLERMDKVVCDVCKKTFYDKKLLIDHMAGHPTETANDSPKVLRCAGVYNKENVKSLVAEHRLACKICGKTFKDKISLNHHVRRQHLGVMHFVCDACGINCCDRSALINHLRIHTGEKPYSCKICKRPFTRIHHLKRHMTIHTGEKPYHCKVCKRQFRRPEHLHGHEKTHTLTCDVCGTRCRSSNRLTRHKRTHANDTK